MIKNIDETIKNMTLEEKVGQLFTFGFKGPTISPELEILLKDRKVGGLLLYSYNMENPKQLRKLTEAIQNMAVKEGSGVPLFLATDQEGGNLVTIGLGNAIPPSPLALAATGNPKNAFIAHQISSRVMRSLGINLNYAPLLDFNQIPNNPNTGTRVFSSNISLLSEMAVAYIKGLAEGNVASCAKHFPGYGNIEINTHNDFPVNPTSAETLREREYLPYQKAVSAGVDMIMLGHVAFPNLQEEENLPASLSPSIVNGELRKYLGFPGVIATDDIRMGAIVEHFPLEAAAIKALQAGVDNVILAHQFPLQERVYQAVRESVKKGELSLEGTEESVRRILKLKKKLFDPAYTPLPLEDTIWNEAYEKKMEEIAAQAITLVGNNENLIPLNSKNAGRILLVVPAFEQLLVEDPDIASYGVINYLRNQIYLKTDNIEVQIVDEHPASDQVRKVMELASHFEVVIVCTAARVLGPPVSEKQVALVKRLASLNRKLVVISFSTPYDLIHFPEVKTYLVAYDWQKATLRALVKILFGEIRAEGILPVDLPAELASGHSRRRKRGPATFSLDF